MTLTNDVELGGVAYNLVPGSYKKGRRKALSVSKPAARKIGEVSFGPFGRGLLAATAADEERGWEGITVGPVFDGAGVEPFPLVSGTADAALLDTPSLTQRCYGAVAGATAYVGIGRCIYKSVALSAGAWGNVTMVADLGAGFVISGLVYYQDNLLILLSSGQDIRQLNTATNAITVWRTSEKGAIGAGYAGQLLYGVPTAGLTDYLALSGIKWNGNAVTHYRQLDSPIIRMANYNGRVAIATRKSLYLMGGQSYPGEADDAAVTADTSKAPLWIGDPQPIMTHGAFTEGDDLIFLESYRGKLYTWLGGRVAEFDGNTGEPGWLRIGPDGVACYGACVSGAWLLVSLACP